jgi:hypothetical protein
VTGITLTVRKTAVSFGALLDIRAGPSPLAICRGRGRTESSQLRNLGPASGASLRVFVKSRTHHLVHKLRAAPTAEAFRARREEAAQIRAKHYV